VIRGQFSTGGDTVRLGRRLVVPLVAIERLLASAVSNTSR